MYLLLKGILIGLVAGVLLAPKSGRLTRDQIKNTAKDYYGKATSGVTKLRKDVETELNKDKKKDS